MSEWLNGEPLFFNEQRGDSDCLRAALATILGVPYEHVPEEVAQPEDQHNAMQRYLAKLGLVAWTFGLHGEETPQLMFGSEPIPYHVHPTGYWLASVKSPRNDDDHVVVMRGQSIIWDPHPLRGMGHRGFTQAIILMPRDGAAFYPLGRDEIEQTVYARIAAGFSELLQAAEDEVGPKGSVVRDGKTVEEWAEMDETDHVPGVQRRIAMARGVLRAREAMAATEPRRGSS